MVGGFRNRSLGRQPAGGGHCLHVWKYRVMIARTWRGAVRAEDAPAYAAYVQKTGIEGYQRTPGNCGAWLLWRVEGDQAEFVTVSFWESRASIEAFAGQDIEKAVFYPDDERFLIERDLTVHHYEVAGTEASDG